MPAVRLVINIYIYKTYAITLLKVRKIWRCNPLFLLRYSDFFRGQDDGIFYHCHFDIT